MILLLEGDLQRFYLSEIILYDFTEEQLDLIQKIRFE